MHVIPAINCPDAASAAKLALVAKTFLAPGSLLHIDVTDGIFTGHAVWADAAVWRELRGPLGLEVHLMVEHPEERIEAWVLAGMRRCIVPAETADLAACREIIDRCASENIKVMLSSSPETSTDAILPYCRTFSEFQVLTVDPGAAGQAFMPQALAKAQFLRERMHDAIIEVDGGINPGTALLAKAAGADTVVSASYIFGSTDPKLAYETLCRV